MGTHKTSFTRVLEKADKNCHYVQQWATKIANIHWGLTLINRRICIKNKTKITMRFLVWLSSEQLCFIIPKKIRTVKYFPIFEGPLLYIFYYANTKKLKLMQKYIVVKFSLINLKSFLFFTDFKLDRLTL